MTIRAGIDEAGYGPRLGPLVVSATAFRVPPELAEADLWQALSSGVAARKAAADGRMVIADSKYLYSGRSGLAWLEEGTLAAVEACQATPRAEAAGAGPTSFRSLLEGLGAGRAEEYRPYPWYEGLDLPLPLSVAADRIEARARRLERALERCGSAAVAVFAVPIVEGRFNRLLARTRNKSEVAFEAVAFLLRRLRGACPGEVLNVTVDKQGGRTHYLHLLLRHFPEADVEVRSESHRLSKYVLRERLGKMELAFRVRAESDALPVALASMVSKYVREVFMHLFNAYWQGRVEGLERTSGYPADARPFITALKRYGALDGLDRDLLIRRR